MDEAALSPIDVLAVEFVTELRSGRRPLVADYERRHPDMADQIRDLFPTIEQLETARTHHEKSDTGVASLGPTKLRRLGDLRIIREIGRGGMGIVYLAEQESLQRHVAVKVLPKQATLDEKYLRRFEREARTAGKLHHTNIVPILGVGEHDGFRYYVMQYIRGVGLDRVVQALRYRHRKLEKANDHHRPDASIPKTDALSIASAMLCNDFDAAVSSSDSNLGAIDSDSVDTRVETSQDDESSSVSHLDATVPLQDVSQSNGSRTDADESHARPPEGPSYVRCVAEFGRQVADALHYAHDRGVLHRDVKPGNLIVDSQGVVWVADFGLAKTVEHDDVSRTGDVLGTIRYMAPEQFRGEYDARSDIYSLGLTLYELLTLRTAYDDKERRSALIAAAAEHNVVPPSRINPEIPRDLETVVLKAMSHEIAHRYETAEELALDLQRFLEDRPIHARRATAMERFARWCRRNPALAATSAIAAILMMTVAIVSTTAYFRTSRANARATDALERMDRQRNRAQSNADLAWDALDRIFDRFAPPSYVLDSSASSTDVEFERADMQAVLSDEAVSQLSELITFYGQLREQDTDNLQLRRRIALANRRAGDIYQHLGDEEAAERSYRESLDIYQSLADENPSNVSDQVALARVHNELGKRYRGRSGRQQSEEHLAAAEDLLKPYANESAPAEARFELARNYYLQLKIPRRGPPPDAGDRPPSPRRRSDWGFEENEQKLDDAAHLLEALTDAHPGEPDFQHLLGLVYLEGASLYRRRDPRLSQDYWQYAVSILKELDALYRKNPEYAYAVCEVLATGSPRDDDLTDSDLRLFANRLSQARWRSNLLVDAFPNIPEYREQFAMIHHKLASVSRQLDRERDAERYYREALDAYLELSERYSDEPHRQVWSALVRHSLAELLVDRGTPTALYEAKDHLHVAASTLQQFDQKDDHRSRFMRGRMQEVRALITRVDELLESAETVPTPVDTEAPASAT